MTQSAIKSQLDGKLSTSGTAAAATKDSGGNTINTTYIKSVSVSGQTVTFTKGDNSTFSISTQDSNTTYATGTTAVAGLTKLYGTTGTNEDGTMTQKAIKSALDGKLNSSGTAAAATKDSGGNTINTTYIKNATVSGKVVTFTKGDGSTFTITTQDTDNNTTYATGTTAATGLTKLYASTGANTDGTIRQKELTDILNDNIVNASASGKTVTFTKGDGSTFSITTQDNNTTYGTGTTATAGLTKLYTTTGTATDGTMTQNAIKSALDGKLSTSGSAASAKVLNNSTSTNSLGADVLVDFGDEG
jgi:hypothetical protein